MKMSHFYRPRRMVAAILAATMCWLSVGAPRLEAMVVPANAVAPMAPAVDRDQDLSTVQAALENKVIRQRLSDLGLSAPEIDQRLERLSHVQLHQVAMQIDEQTAGGDGAGGVISVLLIVLLVVLIVKLID